MYKVVLHWHDDDTREVYSIHDDSDAAWAVVETDKLIHSTEYSVTVEAVTSLDCHHHLNDQYLGGYYDACNNIIRTLTVMPDYEDIDQMTPREVLELAIKMATYESEVAIK